MTQGVCSFELQPHVCKSVASLRTRGPRQLKCCMVTTSGDHCFQAGRVERVLECSLDRFRLQMAVALGDRDRAVPRNARQREGIAELGEPGERGVPKVIWHKCTHARESHGFVMLLV